MTATPRMKSADGAILESRGPPRTRHFREQSWTSASDGVSSSSMKKDGVGVIERLVGGEETRFG